MDNNIRVALIVIIGLALSMGAGCATSKVWISSPVAQAAGNPYYEAKIEPLKSVNKFFVSFRLVVINRTDKNLEIDWNKTRYIYNGRTHGVFIFDGVKPEDIKNLTMPADTIVSGQSFKKSFPRSNYWHAPPLKTAIQIRRLSILA